MNKVIKQWDDAALRFLVDQEQSEFANVNKTIIRERFQDLCSKTVLDLGYGYGYYTDYFDGIGAQSLGVDGSDTMIQIAKERYPDSKFSLVDITKPLPFVAESFDMIFCNQVLMDIAEIKDVFTESYRILKHNGVFYYTIVHPAFFDGMWQIDEKGYKYAKAISKYLSSYELQNHFWGETTHFHRPLSEYLNAASDAGFSLIHTEEPRTYNGETKTSELPLFFVAEYKKI